MTPQTKLNSQTELPQALLTSRTDTPERAADRASQPDPLVMYLVVRSETAASYADLLAAAARGTIACAERFAREDDWAEAMELWYEESYRKVTLRADETQWAALASFEGSRIELDREELLMVLPPRRKSEREPLLKKLQTYQIDPATMPERKSRAKAGFPTLLVVMNGAVPMSAGKAAAQVGHAALAAVRSEAASEHAITLWRRKGCPVEIASAGQLQWQALKARPEASLITDRGLTEIVPNTETVLAFPPLLAPVEPEIVRSLARP